MTPSQLSWNKTFLRSKKGGSRRKKKGEGGERKEEEGGRQVVVGEAGWSVSACCASHFAATASM